MVDHRLLMLLFLCGCLAPNFAGCARDRSPAQHVARPSMEKLASAPFPTASDRVIKRDRGILERNARWMLENPQAVLILEGHCDERGGDEYNMELGDRRARRVKEELVRLGVPAQAMAIVSHGERKPLDGRHTPEAWRKNRRVEFTPR